MMKKFFKIATICSLAISLSASNFAFATEPDPDPAEPDTVSDENGELGEHPTRTYIIKADIKAPSGTQYAVDIFCDRNLTFYYQAITDYNPYTLEESYAASAYGKGIVGDDAEDTAAREATAARDYNPNLNTETADGKVLDSDSNPEGAWYGFDGVTNRLVVLNRSSVPVKMTATSSNEGVQLNDLYDSTATINLYLNGDNISNIMSNDPEPVVESYAWEQRLLNLTHGKTVAGLEAGDDYEAGLLLYANEDETPAYTDNMSALLSLKQAFSTKEDDAVGGRFSANPEGSGSGDVTIAAAKQTSDDSVEPEVVADNYVIIAGHSESGADHYVGYSLVYFDITGKPFDLTSHSATPAVYRTLGLVNSSTGAPSDNVVTKIGTITLSFSGEIS